MFTEPVSEKKFFGRKKILDLLDKRLEALKSGCRQNVALTGQMLSGKSSILKHFLNSIRDSSIIPVYIELCDEPFSAFADKFIGTLLYNFFKLKQISATKEIKALLEKAKKHIPLVSRLIDEIRLNIKRRRYNHAYRQLLELTSVLKQETGASCVCILDEFHNLENFGVKNPYLYLGKVIMIQKDTMYIVSSSEKSRIRKILSEKLSLLFGNFEVVEVTGFGPKTARLFLKERIAPINISEYYADYILNLTDKNPFYLDVISKAIKRLDEKAKIYRINVGVIKDVLTEILYNPTGVINQHFTNNIHFLFDKSLRKENLHILSAMVGGPAKLKEITLCVKNKVKNITKKLDQLIEMDIVSKCGVFYNIQDRFFRFWLKNVYFKKIQTIITTRDEGINEFKASIDGDVENYLIEYNKGTLERMCDLFRSFNDEVVEINKKLRRLPKFVKIETLKYGHDKNYLTCEKKDKYWVCQVKHQRVEESDVIDLIETCNKGRENVTRKVLIPLADIDTNALLLAKERNIWVWDSRSVNLLLNLYKRQDLIAGEEGFAR